MRGVRAKEIRREIYHRNGKKDFRDRRYHQSHIDIKTPSWFKWIVTMIAKVSVPLSYKIHRWFFKRVSVIVPYGNIVSDDYRRAYQALKKEYKQSKRND
jgi:hypothetical protein